MKIARNVAVAIVHCPATHRILLVTSRKNKGLWIFPKGGVEVGEDSAQAAVREAHEEAGTPLSLPVDSVSPPLFIHALEHNTDERAAVWYFHAVSLASERDILSDWLEKDERKRKWVSPKEALECIRQWGGMIGQGGDDDDDYGEGSMERGGKKKKAIKGDAYEMGLTAFARIYGWEKK